MSKYFDHLLSVIPFEVNFFKKYGLKTTYIGHPFIETIKKIDDTNFKKKYNLYDSKTIIFLPGSRKGEIDRHSPIMSQTIKYLKEQNFKLNILIAAGQKQLNQMRVYFPDVEIITNDNGLNKTGVTYIYMAFAEQPFVNSNGVPANAR